VYAILDIETTGGQYNEEGITEIAIYRFDGRRVTDQFISLVNPEREIQPFVVNLTGINSAMLRSAPKFYEVAKRIVEITENCILVAHNAQFDYRILQTEFRRLGFDFQRRSLCTVELSKKLIPGQPSYSLGKLVRSLGIPVSDRHRANGDAQATLKLFKMLLAKDTAKSIITETIREESTGQLSTKFLDIIDKLPSTTGVYYIHGENGKIVYIGKSKNIKRRVNQHFTGATRKSRRLQKEVIAVTYEETGNELIALLKENEEIKQNQPVYNRSRKRKLFPFALYSKTDENGFLRLYIEKSDHRKKMITAFASIHEAKNVLYKLTEEYTLCTKLNALSDARKQCFNYTIGQCYGACIGEETPENYNTRVEQAISRYSYSDEHMVIIGQGRDVDERSAILIEENRFKGLGFYNLNYQIHNLHILQSVITPMENNVDADHIIQSFLRRKNNFKIISLNHQKND